MSYTLSFALIGALIGGIIGVPGCFVIALSVENYNENHGFIGVGFGLGGDSTPRWRNQTKIFGKWYWNPPLLLGGCVFTFGTLGAVAGGCIGKKIDRKKDK